MKNNLIPVNGTIVSERSKELVKEALDTGWISSSGPFVKDFENNFSSYIGRDYALALSSGTAALHVALMALGIGEGDEVIVPAFTMGATWLSILYTGAKPVFVDVEEEYLTLDPDQLESKINKKTKSLIAVHIYGNPADMDSINEVAKKHDLFTIEDAAESHGALYKGRLTGSLSDISCFSFYANKIIATGEGGMLLTDDKKIYEDARKFSDLYHSQSKRFIHEKIGYNYRFSNVLAAIGLGELENIDKYLKRKEQMATRYTHNLSSLPGLILPKTRPSCTNVNWMYAIRVREDEFGINRNTLREELTKANIQTRDFFYPPHDHPVLKGFLSKEESFPITERVALEGLYLPSGLSITDKEIDFVSDTIKKIYKGIK